MFTKQISSQTSLPQVSILRTAREKGNLVIAAPQYLLTLVADRPYAVLSDARGKRLVELFVYSSVHALHARDDSTSIGKWEIRQTEREVIATITTHSSAWREKTYRFVCRPNRLVYEIEVEGAGQLCEVEYFGGYFSGQPRWGSGFFWSGQSFQRGFTPEPNADETAYFGPAESTTIDLMGVPLPGKSSWFFTPPPFCFALQGASGWLGLGIEALPGENQYTEYHYHGKKSAFYLSLSYEGYTAVAGRYRLPAIGIDFAPDEFSALEEHVDEQHALQGPLNPNRAERPAWWSEPIYCGWGSQCYLARIHKGKASTYARQGLYEGFLRDLEANGVEPGIVVLDDKWQAAYGENLVDLNKWPDLPGFIRGQHRRGRKVLLWLKAWDPEGIPADECITNAEGLPLAVDPTNPDFEARLRASIQRMLGLDGYDADGFKIDFTARIPSGPGLCRYGDAWGLELMKRYLEIIYSEAKRVKPEALVMTHTPHPYLANVLDMIRLNDINMKSDINAAMQRRARLASIACPQAIVDTDNWPIPNKAAWRKYLQLQPELGVPSLYYANHIDQTGEALNARDYALIRRIWARHRARLSQAVLKPPRRRPLQPTGPKWGTRFFQGLWRKNRLPSPGKVPLL